MIIGRIALVGLSLVALGIESAKHLEVKPSWTLALEDSDLEKGVFSQTPQTNRSCGIAKWDQAHVLIYFMSNTKTLVARSPAKTPAGGWSFSILIVRTRDGEVEQSATIPADSSQSELAVVARGIVVSDRDHLSIYSRAFARIDPAFAYAPLGARLRNGEMGDQEYIYAFDDQQRLLLVDDNAHKSHFYLFDGNTMRLLRDWSFNGVDVGHLQIKDEKIIYGRLILGDRQTSTFWWTPADVSDGTAQAVSTTSSDVVCRFRIPNKADTFLDICGSLKTANKESEAIVYQPHKGEIISDLVQISPDGHYAAILRYDYKRGGVLDLTEHWIRPGLLIIDLSTAGHLCEIPLEPVPTSQLAFSFVSESTLIVLSDDAVNAYKALCF
jgi:hypothetical protein